jgi:ADP-ribosyl-[dinitrogen reductase] hydrolase
MIDDPDRYLGCLLGLACGDAIGTTVEFGKRGSFAPVTDMIGGGPFNLEAGQWTDDTSMALCLAESLLDRNGFDAIDQMNRYVNWWQHGYLSSTGTCFDIGNATAAALRRYLEQHEESRSPFCGATAPNTAGNGSLMRLAPIAMFYREKDSVVRFAAESSRTTHGAPEAVDCCRLLSLVLHELLAGASQEALAEVMVANCLTEFTERSVRGLCTTKYMELPIDAIRGSGYCIESLHAALWCFFTTSTFAEAILKAVNLGDDADTTGAIVGQIAGAYYGVASIPSHWRARLSMVDYIEAQAMRFYQLHT